MKRVALLFGGLAVLLTAALATIAPSAALAAAPNVATAAASALTPTTATVNGSVNLAGGTLNGTQAGLNTAGADTTGCYFEYGTTTSYGSYASCSPTPVNASSTTTGVSAALSSLTSGTTYHYRVVLQVAQSVLLGAPIGATEYDSTDASFTTPSASVPPTVATAPASAVGGTSALLNGTVNPQNWSISSCTFTYGPSGGATQTAACTNLPSGTGAQGVSAPVVGLSEGTTYNYSLSVVYGSGTSATASSTSSGSFTTTSASVSAPGSLTATGATLAGSVNPEGQSVSSCTFYYGTSATSLSSIPCAQATGSISGSSPVSVSATLTGLRQKTNYIDTVVLVTAQGTAVATAGSFTTLATPTGTTAPATAVTATTATLHGTVNAGGEGVTACAFEWGVNPLTSSSNPGADLALVEPCTTTPAANGSQAVTVTLKGLAPGTKYYDRVVLTTYGGYVIANTQSFRTPAVVGKPTLRITAAKINAKARSARFSFARTGSVSATKGFQCALVTVTHGKAGKARYSACHSARTYTKLRATRYVFSVRAGNASGFGKAVSRTFTI